MSLFRSRSEGVTSPHISVFCVIIMAAPAPARRVLVAVGRDAADAARTLRWSAAHVARAGDRVSLVHVRAPEVLAAAATPVVEVAVPAATLPNAVWGADKAAADDVAEALKMLQAAASAVDAVELRSMLRVSDAILSYIRFLPAEEKADALVMGSHGARYVGSALWKVPHASLDIAAGNTACAMFFLRGEPAELPPGTARFVALSLDGASPASSLLTRWAIANALRPVDTVIIVNKNAAADPKVDDEIHRCEQLLSSYLTSGGGSVATYAVPPARDVRDQLVDLSETGLDARVGPPELLVMGTRGESARSLKRLVLGSTAEYVVKTSACPLCVVPPLVETAGAVVLA